MTFLSFSSHLLKKVNLKAISISLKISMFCAHIIDVLGDIIMEISDDLNASLIRFASLTINLICSIFFLKYF